MTAPTISATPKKALDQRATSRHDNARPPDQISSSSLTPTPGRPSCLAISARPDLAWTISSFCRGDASTSDPVAPADWYEMVRFVDGVTLIHEPWIKPFFRCNI